MRWYKLKAVDQYRRRQKPTVRLSTVFTAAAPENTMGIFLRWIYCRSPAQSDSMEIHGCSRPPARKALPNPAPQLRALVSFEVPLMETFCLDLRRYVSLCVFSSCGRRHAAASNFACYIYQAQTKPCYHQVWLPVLPACMNLGPTPA